LKSKSSATVEMCERPETVRNHPTLWRPLDNASESLQTPERCYERNRC